MCGVFVIDVGIMLLIGNVVYDVNGVNGIVIVVEGGVKGMIDVGVMINLNVVGVMVGVVDG